MFFLSEKRKAFHFVSPSTDSWRILTRILTNVHVSLGPSFVAYMET